MKKIIVVGVVALLCVARTSHAQTSTPGAQSLASVPNVTNAATVTSHVAIATRDLARGGVLSATDMKWIDTTGISRSPSDTERVAAGWVARRTIRAGEILREPGVSRPDMVSNGDAVDVVYSAPGVTIKVRGTAIGSGAQGDEVYVKLENRKRLRGVVAAANTVRVM